MKVVLLSVVVALLAGQVVARELRGGSGSKNRADHGDASKIELFDGNDDCLSVDREREGEELIIEDCDRAPRFVYRDDHLVELDDESLCLEANSDEVELRRCDSGDGRQEWYFLRVPTDDSDPVYRIMNVATRRFIQKKDRDEIELRSDDADDEDQWVVDLDDGFFDTDHS